MSKKDQFNFTTLDEEDDDDEATYQSGSLDLQPHLGQLEEKSTTDPQPVHHSRSSNEKYDHQDGIDNPALSTDLDEPPSSFNCSVSYEANEPTVASHENNGHAGNHPDTVTDDTDVSFRNGKTDTAVSVSNNSVATPHAVNIQYDNSGGKVHVMQGRVETRPDGSQYIDTRGIPQTWAELEQPLRQRKIRFLKIFATISCFFFLPSGIAALYYAFQTEKEFNEGIMRGSIDKAQKFAKRSERFIVLSFIMAIVVAALVVAIVERPHYTNNLHKGTIVG